VALRLRLGRFGGRIAITQGHVVILGRSGSGKTNTAKVIVAELMKRGVPVLVLDWAGEYASPRLVRLVPGENLALDVLPPGSDDPEHVDVIVDLFDAVFHLTQPQLYMLRLAVKQAIADGCSGIKGILDALEKVPIRSYYDHETRAALVRRLAPLSEGRVARALEGGAPLEAVLSKSFAVDLSVFKSVYAKRLFTLLLLKEVYDRAVARGPTQGIVHATLIEEAWNVIPYRRPDAEPTIGERLFAELRKYGECAIAVAQNPAEIAWSVVNNAEILVVHAMMPKGYEALGLQALALRTGEAIVIERGRARLVRVRKAR